MSVSPRREPPGLAILRATVTALGRAEMVIAVLALSSAALIGMAQIALRYTTGRSFWWGQEVSILLMLVAYFVGGAVVYRLRYDVVVSYFVDRFTSSLRHPVYIFVQLLTLLFWVTLAWQLVTMIPAGLKTYSAIMRIPKVFAMLPLLYASTSIALLSLYVLLARFHAGWSAPVDSVDEVDRQIRRSFGGEGLV
jgi:TRAP-type C4-dicarboxylate transport system permease small subunit